MSDAAFPTRPDALAAPLAPTTVREILSLALPASASGLVMVAYHWINQIWVGRLSDHGPAPVAALSVATFGTWAFGALSALAGTGLGALVGRYVGAAREDAARYVALHGLRFAAALGFVVGVIGVVWAPLIAAASNVSVEAADMCTGYLRCFYAAGFALLAQSAADAIFRAHGNTRTPFLVAACTLTANALLDPVLMFGVGPIPVMGVSGAGLASALSITGGVIASTILLRRRGYLSSSRPSDAAMRLDDTTPIRRGSVPGIDLSVVFRVARVGVPMTLAGLFFVGIYFGLSGVVTEVGGDAAQAGIGAGLRGELVAWSVTLGFSVAAASLVSRRLGAHRPDDAARCAVRAGALGSGVCAIWGALLFVLADPLSRLFIPEAESGVARAYAADFYRIVAPCLMFQAWEHVLEGAFSGAGLTWPPMAVSVALTVIRIPLARYVAIDLDWGVRGIWIVIAVTAGLRGVCIAIWFSRGTWKHRRV